MSENRMRTDGLKVHPRAFFSVTLRERIAIIKIFIFASAGSDIVNSERSQTTGNIIEMLCKKYRLRLGEDFALMNSNSG